MTLPNSKLGSHGVRIVAGCCLIDFFTGELPSTPGTLTRNLRELSIPAEIQSALQGKEKLASAHCLRPVKYLKFPFCTVRDFLPNEGPDISNY